MLGVGDGVADDVLQEDLEHAARLLVDEPRDALDAAAPRQAADGRLGDALDVVAQHLAVALGAALAEPPLRLPPCLPPLATAPLFRPPGRRWRLRTKNPPTFCCRTSAAASWARAKLMQPSSSSMQ